MNDGFRAFVRLVPLFSFKSGELRLGPTRMASRYVLASFFSWSRGARVHLSHRREAVSGQAGAIRKLWLALARWRLSLFCPG